MYTLGSGLSIWDNTTRQVIASIDSNSMAVSPDGDRIAAGAAAIQQWDSKSGEAFGPPIRGNDLFVRGIAYSPDGRYLATVAWDNTLRFFDAKSGHEVGELVDTASMGEAFQVEFSRDGRRVFVTTDSVSLDGAPAPVGGGIWELPGPAAWVDKLCDKLTSNPTHQQWDDWISRDIGYFNLCPAKGDPP